MPYLQLVSENIFLKLKVKWYLDSENFRKKIYFKKNFLNNELRTFLNYTTTTYFCFLLPKERVHKKNMEFSRMGVGTDPFHSIKSINISFQHAMHWKFKLKITKKYNFSANLAELSKSRKNSKQIFSIYRGGGRPKMEKRFFLMNTSPIWPGCLLYQLNMNFLVKQILKIYCGIWVLKPLKIFKLHWCSI